MLLHELDEEKNPVRHYVLGNEYIGLDNNYYLTDEQGSVRYAAGNVQNDYRYNAFGQKIAEHENIPNRLKYNAQIEDDLTGLYYLRARYYNTGIGRFTQEDVIYNDGLNLYAYCSSNPVMYVDPSGFVKKTCKSKVGGECGSESGSNFGFTVEEINNLKNTVISEGQMLKDIGLTNDQLGPAIAGAYDRTTGKIYTAINDYDGKVPSELAPIIRERIENMPPEVLDSYIKTKGAGSHAEIYAVNKLLLDNPNAQIGDIAIYVNRTLGTSKPVIEIPFETCPHC